MTTPEVKYLEAMTPAITAKGLPGYDPTSADGANLNAVIGNRATDPISGSVPHRS